MFKICSFFYIFICSIFHVFIPPPVKVTPKPHAWRILGLAYMHGNGIMHCDMKPQNILLDGKTHGLRICDFGTAVRLSLNERRVSYVCSRYFRAPEIILGSTCYNTSIDLWSAGCILGEMILPLFLIDCFTTITFSPFFNLPILGVIFFQFIDSPFSI